MSPITRSKVGGPKPGFRAKKSPKVSRLIKNKKSIPFSGCFSNEAESCGSKLPSKVPCSVVAVRLSAAASREQQDTIPSGASSSSFVDSNGEKKKKKKKRGRPKVLVQHDDRIFGGDQLGKKYRQLQQVAADADHTDWLAHLDELKGIAAAASREELILILGASMFYRQGVPVDGYEPFHFRGLGDVRPLTEGMRRYLWLEVQYISGTSLRDLVTHVFEKFFGEDLRWLVRWSGQETSKALISTPKMRNRNVKLGFHLPRGVCEEFEQAVFARWKELGYPCKNNPAKTMESVRTAFQLNLSTFVQTRLKAVGAEGLFDVYARLDVTCGNDDQQADLKKLCDREIEYQVALGEFKKKKDA